jgi:hypothetical protein
MVLRLKRARPKNRTKKRAFASHAGLRLEDLPTGEKRSRDRDDGIQIVTTEGLMVQPTSL